jgi:5'-nucleotidase
MLEKITTLFLDMDGTLLDLHFDTFFWTNYLPRRFSEIHDLPAARASAKIAEYMKTASGTTNWSSTEHWADTLDLNIIALKHELKHLIGYRPGTQEFLRSVKDSSIQIVLLTDADPHVIALKEATLCESGPSLLQYMDKVISSRELGYLKENTAFWPSLTRLLSFTAASSSLIDDNLAVLQNARNSGIEHLVAISQPDSTKPQQNTEPFKSVNHLNDLIPVS